MWKDPDADGSASFETSDYRNWLVAQIPDREIRRRTRRRKRSLIILKCHITPWL
jgi:hypothetical protein